MKGYVEGGTGEGEDEGARADEGGSFKNISELKREFVMPIGLSSVIVLQKGPRGSIGNEKKRVQKYHNKEMMKGTGMMEAGG